MGKMNKYIEIGVLKHVPLRSYVSVDSNFRIELFSEAIKKAGSRSKLAKIIKVNKGTLTNWRYNKKYNISKLPLDKLINCCKFTNIPFIKLEKNIRSITARYPAGEIKVEHWNIKFDEKFAEWLGMLNGDGSISDRDVSFSNTYFYLTLYFAKFLEKKFKINKDRITMIVTYYTDDSIKEAKRLAKQVKQKGYDKIRIYRAYNHKGKKINLKAKVCFKILSQLLLSIKNDLSDILNESSKTIKAAYLKGYSAAEGCISQVKCGARYITIAQKNRKELEFIKFLLKESGIKRIDGPRWTGTAFTIAASNGADIGRFQQKIGFGAHTLKNDKLRHILNSYKQKRWL